MVEKQKNPFERNISETVDKHMRNRLNKTDGGFLTAPTATTKKTKEDLKTVPKFVPISENEFAFVRTQFLNEDRTNLNKLNEATKLALDHLAEIGVVGKIDWDNYAEIDKEELKPILKNEDRKSVV